MENIDELKGSRKVYTDLTLQEAEKPENLILFKGYKQDGLTNEQIAAKMGIATSTLYSWQNQSPAIKKALSQGREAVDFAVQNKLLERALSGNTTALIFWLKSRKHEMFGDRAPIQPEGSNPQEDLLLGLLDKLTDSLTEKESDAE